MTGGPTQSSTRRPAARRRAVALACASLTAATLGACGHSSSDGSRTTLDAADRRAAERGTTAERATTTSTTEPPTTTTTELTPEQQVKGLLGVATWSATVPYEISDAHGYTYKGSYAVAYANVEKDIENSEPGRAKVALDIAAISTITNTTPGRSVPIDYPGEATLEIVQPEGLTENPYGNCEDRGFAQTTCHDDRLSVRVDLDRTDLTTTYYGGAGIPEPIEAFKPMRYESGVLHALSMEMAEADVDRYVDALKAPGGPAGFTLQIVADELTVDQSGKLLHACVDGEEGWASALAGVDDPWCAESY